MTKNRTQASRCAIMCQSPMFWLFLKSKIPEKNQSAPWAKLETKKDAANAVRYLLEIDSRREIDSNPVVLKKWNEMDAEFEFWVRGM